MILSRQVTILLLALCSVSRTVIASDDEGEDHDNLNSHEDEMHEDHTGHDHTGQPHGHGDIDQNCPSEVVGDDGDDGDDHDNLTSHEDEMHEDHTGHDHTGQPHGHGDDGDDDDHNGHEQRGYDGQEGACPSTDHMFDENDIYFQVVEELPQLNDRTICMYVTTDKAGVVKGVIASIQVGTTHKSLFWGGIVRKRPFLKFVIGGVSRNINTKFLANTEVHICMVADTSKKTLTVFLNGEQVSRTLKYPRSGAKGGIIRIGRITDDSHPMYKGRLRNYMIWDKMLTSEQIMKIFKDNYCPGDAKVVLVPEQIIPLKANVPVEACPMIEYTLDNSGNKVEYLESSIRLPTTKYLTVCVQITTNAMGIIPGTIASFATKDQPEMISVGGEIGADGKPYTRFVVAGQTKKIVGKYMPNTNYRFCMVYHLQQNQIMTYINGQLSKRIKFDNVIKEMAGGGTMLVGQRQQKLGGCFDRKLAYNGKLQDFTVWTRAFSEEEVAAYAAGNCPTDAHATVARRYIVPHGRFYSYSACPASDFTINNQGNNLQYVNVTKTIPENVVYHTDTICVKLTTNAIGMIPGTVSSYSTNEMKQAIAYGGEMGEHGAQFYVTVNGQTKYQALSVAPNTEYHFCLSMHLLHGHVLAFINGKYIAEMDFHNASPIIGGGKTIIGQNQGCPGGCFNRDKAYTGSVKNFMIWGRILSTEEMTAIATSNECPDDHIIDLVGDNRVDAKYP